MTCPHCSAPQPDEARFCGSCGKSIQPTEPATHSAPRPRKATLDLIGREIAGRYRIVEKLGEGGMGAVYRAQQISLKRKVALKLLKPELSSDPGILRRFNTEAELAAKLNHPNTVTLYDFGQDTDGTLFIAMEFIEGHSLRDVITTEAPLDSGRALRIIEQVCDSLAHAHQHGIVHRDLKPDNVMLSERGREKEMVTVLDFGIAKLRDERGDGTQMPVTQAGDMLGTPQYMAPEQIRGEEVDGRTDIYAVGAMLYEMVTGRLPFEGPTLMAILSKHLTDLPQPPAQRRPDLTIPPQVDTVIMQSLQKPIAARPQSMEGLAAQIGTIRQGLGLATQRPGTGTGAPTGAGANHAVASTGHAAPAGAYGQPPLAAAHSPAPIRPPGVPLTSPPGAHYATPAPQANAVGTPAPTTSAPNVTPPAYAPTVPGPTPHPAHGTQPVARSSSGKLGLWIGLGGVAVAGIAVAVVLHTRGAGDDGNKKNNKDGQTDVSRTSKDGTSKDGNKTGPGKRDVDVTDPSNYDLDLGRNKTKPGTLAGTEWRHPDLGFSIVVPEAFVQEHSADPEAIVFNGSRDGKTVNITMYAGMLDTSELTDEALMDVADSVAESLDGKVLQRKFRTIQGARRLTGVIDAPQHGWRYEFVVYLSPNLAVMARIGSQKAHFSQLDGFRAEFFERRIAMPRGGSQ